MANQSIAIATPDAPACVSVPIPGSKSATCRGIVLGALANGPVALHGALQADDTMALLQAVQAMGIATRVEVDVLHLDGRGVATAPSAEPVTLDMGFGGAPARFAIALASLGQHAVIIDGAPRLRARPMHDAITLLGELGVVATPIGEGPGLPLEVHPSPWSTHSIAIARTSTSQVVSALLLVASVAGGLDVHFTQPPTSSAYLDLTIDMLQSWGIDVTVERSQGELKRICVASGTPTSGVHTIAADASSAVAAACMACAVPGSNVLLRGVDLTDTQPDAKAFALLERAGASCVACDQGLRVGAQGQLHFPDTIQAESMPDAVPVLAALAATNGAGPVRFTGLDTLRVKECDRIEGISILLSLVGGNATIDGNDLIVRPLEQRTDTPITLPTMDDHRMAMAGAVLGLWRGSVRIDDADVVTKSWPTFWHDLAPLGGWEAV